MKEHLGFSYIGLIFLLMLFIPNIIWTRKNHKDIFQEVNNPAASNRASKLNAVEQQTIQRTGRLVSDPRGIRQMSKPTKGWVYRKPQYHA